MNGAAMDCRQDRVLPPRHEDAGAAYQFQTNHLREPSHSKAMNYHSSDSFVVEGLAEYTHTQPSGEPTDPRSSSKRSWLREPLDLPIPDFKIDSNYVGELPAKMSKSLDLDTRIDLLIKSKALAGVLPIFSEQDESDSSFDSDESFLRPDKKRQFKVENRFPPPEDEELPLHLSFDDPETPLSRPPSPFLSRATYLFWFNKAIELKQQAKAQEQELLELAVKRLQDQPTRDKPNQAEIVKQDKQLINSLLDEIGKELKELVKEEFIKEVLEHAAFNALDSWWASQRQLEEESMVVESTSEDFVQNSKHSFSLAEEGNAECRGSSSPIEPYPWGEAGVKHEDKVNNVDNEIPDSNDKCNLTATNDNPPTLDLNINVVVPETVEESDLSEVTVKDQDCSSESAAIVPDSTSECFSQDNCIQSPSYNVQEELNTNEIEEKSEECVSSSVPESTSSTSHSDIKLSENLPQAEESLSAEEITKEDKKLNEGNLISVHDNSSETNVLEQSSNTELKSPIGNICMNKEKTENKEIMTNENSISNLGNSYDADVIQSFNEDLKPKSVNSSPGERESINTIQKLKREVENIAPDIRESVSTVEELKPRSVCRINTHNERESVKTIKDRVSPRANLDKESFKTPRTLSLRPTAQTIPHHSIELPVIDTSGLMDKVAFANRRRRLITIEPPQVTNNATKTDEDKPTTLKLETPSSPRGNSGLPPTQIPTNEHDAISVQNPLKVEDSTEKVPE